MTAKNPKLLYLENNGIEWEINVPDSNLEMIGSVGSETKIYTWLLHTDVLMSLYGFSSVQERSVFLDLLKVDGVRILKLSLFKSFFIGPIMSSVFSDIISIIEFVLSFMLSIIKS